MSLNEVLKEELNDFEKESIEKKTDSPYSSRKTSPSYFGACMFFAGLLLTYTNSGDETLGYLIGYPTMGLGLITQYLESSSD